MIRKALPRAALGCLCLLAAPAAFAQARDNSWEVGYFGGANFYANELKIENGATFGIRVGYNITPALELEVTLAGSEDSHFQQPTSTILSDDLPNNFVFSPKLQAKLRSYNLRAVGNVITDWRRWKPLFFVGVGRHEVDIEQGNVPQAFTDATTVSVGAGIRHFFTDHLAARFEGSIEYAVQEIYWNRVVTAGISGVFGGAAPTDSDGDGITDVHDKCVETPKGAIVDRHGCPHDQDGDGVFDGIDQCADTPKGWPVDEKGCPTDVDGDGVPDGIDKCADTPKGAKVDAEGCPLDGDGDSVFDGLDECPDTPFGARVDDKGCPLDEDKDGVPDGIDQCTNTPAGAVVDAKGCPMDSDGDSVFDGLDECPDTPAWWALDDKGCPTPRLDRLALVILEKVNFRSGGSTLEPDANKNLDKAVEALSYWSDLKLEVGGYTDNRGTPAINEALSLSRAKAVKAYFVAKGIDAARLEVKGYGSANPVADNNTEEGRVQNRRVELKKIGGDEKIHPSLSSYTRPPAAQIPSPEKAPAPEQKAPETAPTTPAEPAAPSEPRAPEPPEQP